MKSLPPDNAIKEEEPKGSSSFLKETDMNHTERFRFREYLLYTFTVIAVMLLCICVGSVDIPLKDTMTVIWDSVFGIAIPEGISAPIILSVRIPRILCVALVGASLSLCGAAMQGLLRNPLADGSTLGVSSGASLGAVLSLAFGVTLPGIPFAGTVVMAMLFAFLSLMAILLLAYALDKSLATNSIILIGVIYSMFVSSLMSLVISFAGEKIKSITFWTMGSLSGSNYTHALLLASALFACGFVILRFSQELNAFSIGEDNARHVGVNVKRVKLLILIAVSVLIGVCVSVGGTIAFVGLVIPHIARMIVGPNHKRLLPASLYLGAVFLLLADLTARTILRPIELSIGVVTSLIGSVVFVFIFYRTSKGR